jgi:hypothetical protein
MFSTHNKDMTTPQTLPKGRSHAALAQSLQPSSPADELQSHYLGVLYNDCNREQFISYFLKELGRLLGIGCAPKHRIYEKDLCFTVHGWHVMMCLQEYTSINNSSQNGGQTDCVLFILKNEQDEVSCNTVSELIDTLNTVYF